MKNITKRQAFIVLGVFLLLAAPGWMLYRNFHQPQPVTAESQQQAETPAGVELAAKNAHIDMLQSQLAGAAKQIAELKNKPPDTVIRTVPVEVIKTVEVERQKSSADFAIVTDPKQPNKKIDLKEVENLPANTPVVLNQYNVHAYKKVVHGFNVYPGYDNGSIKINEVTADVNRRISKNGKYLGITAGYDFEHDEVKIGIRYTF